ncbi:head-tail connector protein [Marivibrio halodurans]|uniref:Head-tail connector protein n=1 Tax=Marivibrio halodurans TaxID=2039722 RepID=A0A8J7SKG7_9PROT|nr:portal protein [Marivibrio halodurans]MBP5858458.1 head-tail connector protein [Marivibrio halodurans]
MSPITTAIAPAIAPDSLTRRYERAKSRRSAWESHWRECYAHALPQRDGALDRQAPGAKKTDRLFDSTAPDAVEQLAASLMAELTPPYARWFDLVPGCDLTPAQAKRVAKPLDEISAVLQSHFDNSNIAVEIHQCFLDLVTAGTASLMFEEADLGERSAFRFTAVPVGEAVLEEGASGRLDVTYRRVRLTGLQFRERFPDARPPEDATDRDGDDGEPRHAVIEAVLPDRPRGFRYMAILEGGAGSGGDSQILAEGRFDASPFINFRWMKAPGEIYGRSPVMKTLPDIKTANKVVELVLKNATIAVTGIWQADDDGVLNPATVKLAPGTIIPKAVGSSGLTPLKAPGEFDISQLVLEDVRARIRRGLLADRLGQINDPRMTATEVLERSAETARMLGATYGRLQSELMMPLARRALAILQRRGEIPAMRIDGREIDLHVVAPITRHRKRAETQNAMKWVEMVMMLGPEAGAVIDAGEAARWLARSMDVPEHLLRDDAASEAPAGMPSGTPAGVSGDIPPPDGASQLAAAVDLLGAAGSPASHAARDPAAAPGAPTPAPTKESAA